MLLVFLDDCDVGRTISIVREGSVYVYVTCANVHTGVRMSMWMRAGDVRAFVCARAFMYARTFAYTADFTMMGHA